MTSKTKPINSEFRLYPFIEKSLSELGWDTRNPLRHPGGQVFTQNEALYDPALKNVLDNSRPEDIVKIDEGVYWVIEAKTDPKDISVAVKEAKDEAGMINRSTFIKCPFATGIAGDTESTYYVETYYLTNEGKWKRVQINGVDTTGFISQPQASYIIENDSFNVENQEIKYETFLKTANSINEILFHGAINKKSRARVIASLLLALVNDENLRISKDPTTLIKDINARVEALLSEYGKGNFAQEIALSLPTSKDNHVKNRNAIAECIQELKSMNIRSAINSGDDLLGHFYEIFLKYANDAKEIGIVLTPRHITRFAAEVTNLERKDYIYDPTCGTGGFLVAALDRVKKTSPTDFYRFRKSHIFGMEQDPEIVGLALVNMIFRGDGNSNIYEGNSLNNFFLKVKEGEQKGNIIKLEKKDYEPEKYERFITKTLMNPPFAQSDEEYKFVDHALSQTVDGGLLFAVLPTSTMSSTNNGRREITWRKGMLTNHTLKAVIKLSDDLFLPNSHKGTYAVVIEAHKPHGNKKVFWGIMSDGFSMNKARRMPDKNVPSNYNLIQEKLSAWLSNGEEPEEIPQVIGCRELNLSDPTLDCGPEAYLKDVPYTKVDLTFVTASLFDSLLQQRRDNGINLSNVKFKEIPIGEVLDFIDRGDCKPLDTLSEGTTPVVTTTEHNNGVEGYYDHENATIYNDKITIPANGSTYRAFYHPYRFAAVQDVTVWKVKPDYDSLELKLYVCAMFNQSSWKFSYFRKGTQTKLKKDVKIAFPVDSSNRIDRDRIKRLISKSVEYEGIIQLMK